MGALADLLRAAKARGDTARYELRATDPAAAWTFQGESMRLLGEAIPQVEALEGSPPGEEPEEPPSEPAVEEDWAQLLDGATGIAGRTKWLLGSTGVDIFVPRNTIVRAPRRCFAAWAAVAGGPMPIGEMVLQLDNGRVARFRHVQSPWGSGRYFALGEPCAVVYDPSMDLLRWPAGSPTPPDGYQHLDLSLASSPERLNPSGGAGGDIDADQYVWEQMGGIPHIGLVPRTPGPVEGSTGRFASNAAAWGAWADRAG